MHKCAPPMLYMWRQYAVACSCRLSHARGIARHMKLTKWLALTADLIHVDILSRGDKSYVGRSQRNTNVTDIVVDAERDL